MSYKVLVIGDSCVDLFQYGTVNRICPEAPVPVFCPTYKTENEGMAGNVVSNIKALDETLQIEFITNIQKPYKIRYVCEKSNQMIMRQDINDKISEKHNIGDVHFFSYDAVVVSDYDKGFLTTSQMSIISEHSKLSFLDTKKPLGSWADYFSFIKINESEYANRKNCTNEDIIITKSEKGATYKGVDYPSEKISTIGDISGAGDTFLAALVVSYLNNLDIKLAIEYANCCSSVVVQKRGVSTI